MELPTFIRSCIKSIPIHMTMERQLFKLIADKVDNDYCLSYGNTPYIDFDHELWNRIRLAIDEGLNCSFCNETQQLHSMSCPRGYGRNV